MQSLFTPWRMAYIRGVSARQGCIFCEKPADPSHHQYILARGRTTFTILNIYPYSVGHLMVVPYRHLGRLSDLTVEEGAELMTELARAERLLRRARPAEGWHLGINLERAAGAGVVGHLHAHVVPHPESGAGGAAGLSETVDDTYARLLPAFAEEA